MKKLINKIKSKYLNTDIREKRKIAIISVLVDFVVTCFAFVLGRAYAYTMTEGTSGVSGTSGRPIANAVENAANATYYLDGIGVVFCIEPGIAAANGVNYSQTDFTKVNYRSTSGSHVSIDVTNTMKEQWSLVSHFYETHQNDYVRAAAQMIIWEISTHGRNNFNDVMPDGYNGSNSFWAKRVDGKTTEVANSYRNIVAYVQSYYQNPSGTSIDPTANRYELEYNASTGRYERVISSDSDIGSYTCSSDNSNISVSINGNNLVVSSGTYINDYATITCNKGGNISSNFFTAANYQTVVHASFTPTKSIAFQVKTQGFPVSIQKKDEYNNNLDGAVFTLTNVTTGTTYTLQGNNTNVVIVPGTYKIVETVVPEGYQKMADKTININSEQHFIWNDVPLQIQFKKVDKETRNIINKKVGFTLYKGNKGNKVKLIDKDPNTGCYTESNSGSTDVVLKPNSDGYVCVRRVSSGATYIVEETVIPDEYQKMDDITIVAPTYNNTNPTIDYGEAKNSPLKVKFYKEDSETGKRINNAGFNVYDGNTLLKFDNRDSNGCYKVNSNGSISEVFTDTNVNNGEICLSYVTSNKTYKLVENTVPNGYKKMPDSQITATDKNNTATNISEKGLIDTPLYMYFNKYDGNTNISLNNVGFKVYKNNKLVKFTTKSDDDCYIESSSGTIDTVYTKDITIKSTKEDKSIESKKISSGVCVKYIMGNTDYEIREEVLPAGYTYFAKSKDASKVIINVDKKTKIQTVRNADGTARTEKIINYPTMFEFIKAADDDVNSKDSTITELIDGAGFEIYKVENGQVVNKTLEFLKQQDGMYYYNGYNGILDINAVTTLNTKNRKFVVKYLPVGEYIIKEKNSANGYYYDKDGIKFKITNLSNGVVEGMSKVSSTMVDNLVKISFTKEDIYKYYNSTDKAKIDQNEKLLDTAKFVLKDSNGNILKLKKLSNGSYRYYPVNDQNAVTEINTYNGKLSISHLKNSSKYILEEVKSPDGFILPDPHPEVAYNIGKNKPESDKDSSITQVIENVPTRVKIEKRSLKDGYLIDNEKVRFELYKCSDSTCKDKNRIYVTEREFVPDANGNLEYAYKYSKLNAKTNTEITTYKGYIVFRYLPKGKYVLVETEAPKGYDLPVGENANTYFDVSGSSVETDVDIIKNKPSKLIIRKYSEDGNLISGARFKIYKVNNYDENLSAKNQDKTELKFKTIRDGEYEYKDIKDTDEITSCIKNCEYIGEETGDKETIKSGELMIQYLDTESYYVIEEVKAPEGYSLPDDPYTLVYLKESIQDVDTDVSIENKYTPVTFYKFDEYNNLLDGAEYKLQKLNSNKKYEDMTVSKISDKDGAVYSVDFNTENKTITTLNGQATIYLLTEGQYRILEVKAKEGYELPKASINVATFFVTSDGKVKGDFVITNKKPTTPNIILNKATSEFVISIQTGESIVRYCLIIFVLCSVITGLIIINKKIGKK